MVLMSWWNCSAKCYTQYNATVHCNRKPRVLTHVEFSSKITVTVYCAALGQYYCV